MAIKNVDKLLRKFNNLENIDITPIIGQAAIIVQKKAKALCPKDTGILRGSISVEVERQNKLFIGRVFTVIEYAKYVEFGTGIKGNGSYEYPVNLTYHDTWKGMKAQPYMYPALIQSKKQVISFVKEEYNKALLSIVGG